MNPEILAEHARQTAAQTIAANIIRQIDSEATPTTSLHRQIGPDIIVAVRLSDDFDNIQVRVNFRQIPAEGRNEEWIITSALLNWPDIDRVNEEWPATKLRSICLQQGIWPNLPIA